MQQYLDLLRTFEITALIEVIARERVHAQCLGASCVLI